MRHFPGQPANALPLIATSLGFLVFLEVPATAADAVAFDNARLSPDQAPTPPSMWKFVVGAGGIIQPEFEGADRYSVTPVPFVSVTYGDWVEINPEGLSATIAEVNALSVDVLVGYELGRSEDDDERLRGLDDIDFGVTAGARLRYEIEPLSLFAAVRKTVNGSEGLIGQIGAEMTMPLSEKLIVGLSASATVADDNYMDAYFSVTPKQSSASGLDAYDAEAGLKSAELSVSATYLLDNNWFVRGEAELGVLLSDAADSPIVERELQPTASLFVGYRF
ncbi:MipA/OmpV family protein [Ensifer canadensis]